MEKKPTKSLLILGLLGSTFLLASCSGEDGADQSSTQSSSAQSFLSSSSSGDESVPAGSEQSSSSTQAESEETASASADGIPADASTDDWNLKLVNRTHQLDGEMDIDFYYTEDDYPMDARIADAYEQMAADAEAAGLDLLLVSSYRSIEQQTANYNATYQSYIDAGYTPEEATEMTEDYIALPNASEHSTGLALDITNPEMYAQGESGLFTEFEDTAEAQWLYENAENYGFVLRYPLGKEDITMIEYESWHFRYVGVENAKYMNEHNLTLEEYVDLLAERENS